MRKFLLWSVFFFALLSWGEMNAQNNTSVVESNSVVLYPTSFNVTPPLRDLIENEPVPLPYANEEDAWESPDRQHRPHQTFLYTVADGPQYGNDSAIIQTTMGPRDISNRAPLQSWQGAYCSSYPPDPTGAVSANHYIQSVNATPITIYNKTGTQLAQFQLGTLFGSGNAGDPIVMYDKFADRWFLSQFGMSNEIFIAISQTNDPLGSYYTYTYVSPQFPDYLKFSIWGDGYYMTSNQGTDKVYVFERDEMLVGNGSARGIFTTFSTGSVSAFYVPLPVDAADDVALPAPGTPLPFMSYYDNAWGGGTDGIKIWEMTTDWGAGTATITGPTQVNTGSFDASYDSGWDDVPQPGTSQMLDGIGGVLMYRAPMRSWSGYNSVVLSWGVLISNSPRQRAIYWCELRQNQSTGVWSLYQEGIYNPDSDTRWMSSMAMDDNGSIALCYAKSSTSTYPGLYYTGRLAGDPLGQMTFGETEVIAGTASQSGINRYGDYAHTSLDPDGVTFWHTGEYITGSSGQESRVYAFQLPAGPLPPNANFVVDNQAPFCSYDVQFTDWSTNVPTSWDWDFGDGNTSTLQNPSHTYAANGTYTVQLTATNGEGSDTEIKTSYVTINVAEEPVGTDGERCGTGTVDLSAAGTNTLNWYDAITGGTLLGTGSSFTTPSISATTTYYVENVITEATQNVGPTVAGSSTNTSTYLTFTVERDMTLVSVDARRQNNGSVTIELQDNTGATLQSYTATIGNSVTTVPLGWTIPAGTDYRLYTPASSRLYYISGASYPYSISGLVSITGNSAGSNFYTSYFNWVVQGSGCSSNRVPVTATVNTAVTPSVSISASATAICAGDNVSFTATPANGGTPTYQWYVNATPSGTGATFASTTLNDGDVVTCEMTSTEFCAVPNPVTSNSVNVTVNSALTPSVTVSASATTICAGENVTFTPTPVNGGGSPAYQWYVNGTPSGTGSTFSSTALSDGDQVTVELTSSESCASPITATSSPVTMTVNSSVVPAVSVSATATTICAGTNVTFTPTPTNGGTPSYQWFVNGTPSGTGATYSSSGLNDGDQVTVEMTSSEACASPTTATSTPITMTVNATLVPSVTVAASATTICAGTNVTFTPTPTNGGTPSYQWYVNATPAGTGSTYSSTALNDGDQITVEMTSSETCASPTTATSTAITMNVNPILTPSVSVTATATTICTGTNVTFTPTPTNGGTPSYQWYVNAVPAGTGSTYSSNTLNDGDQVTVEMTSSETCASPSNATSSPIIMTVNSTVVPSVTVAASATTICAGTNVTFTPTPTNGGTPSYQWYVNATPAGTGATYSSTTLNDGDQVTVEMTSSETCASPTTATSVPVTMTVNATVVPSVTVAASATTICAGTNVTFTPTPTNG
ncbi:MAG: hypothetical protein C0592_14115, partial [Marinilabiliales bacterium]